MNDQTENSSSEIFVFFILFNNEEKYKVYVYFTYSV